MGMLKSYLLERVTQLMKAETLNELTSDDYDAAITDAVREYSTEYPYYTVAEMTPDTSGFYVLPDDYESDFSSILEIEYPKDQSPKEVIDSRDYRTELTVEGLRLRFEESNPTANFYIRYKTSFSFDGDGASEIPTKHTLCLAYLVCSILSWQLSARFATKTNSNIRNIAYANFEGRVDEWDERAKRYHEMYEKMIRKFVSTDERALDYQGNGTMIQLTFDDRPSFDWRDNTWINTTSQR